MGGTLGLRAMRVMWMTDGMPLIRRALTARMPQMAWVVRPNLMTRQLAAQLLLLRRRALLVR